ncbi:MAG TPA: carboxymuconolactone decarboxylase family protein [Sphingomicrobium sp.]|nr:carboxymuconolactone decarboxylase family protein [Sphingomicrobium sp.]
MNERYLKGIDVIQQLSAGSLEQFLTSRLAEVAPDLARMAIEFPFGEIYSRNTLGFRERELVAIAALTAVGSAQPQLRTHVMAALQLGITKAEIVEVIIQTVIYAGFPGALNALSDCHDLLAE